MNGANAPKAPTVRQALTDAAKALNDLWRLYDSDKAHLIDWRLVRTKALACDSALSAAVHPAEWVPAEPQRVHQTKFGKYGDCFACCVATLMGVDLTEIPDEVSSPAQFKSVREWALKRGWRVVTLAITEEVVKDQLAQGFVIVSGKSPRGLPHAVIFKDGKLWHDPHPSLDGVEVIDEVDLFMPLVPSAWQALPPPPAADK